MQGVGNALVQTACYAIITHVFADNREKYLGQAEAVTGIGLMLGPVLGGPLYTFLGYFESFCCFGAMLAVSMIIAIVITPNALNQSIFEEHSNEENHAEDKKVTFSLFLLNKRALFAFLSCALVCFFMSYQSSFLTDVLRKEKHIPEFWNGPILAMPCLTYTISCILVDKATGKIPRRVLILVSFMLLACSMVLQGPSEMLGIPDNNYCVLTGFALNGVAQGFIFIPLLPDALEAVFVKENIKEYFLFWNQYNSKQRFSNLENIFENLKNYSNLLDSPLNIVEGQNEQLDQLISDYGSGLYGTFFSIGQILAPILGGALYESIDYRPTTDFMTLVCLGWCVIFFVFNVGFKIYAKEKKIHAKMVMLSELQQAKSDEERNQSLNHNGSNRKLAKDEDEQEEEIEEFLRKQREKWKQIRDNTAKNHTKQGQTNNLSSIRESKNEGTFLESKAGTGTVQPYQFTGIGAGMQLNENTYSQSNTQSAAGYTPIMSSQRGKRKISGDVENDELQQHLIEQKMKDLQKH